MKKRVVSPNFEAKQLEWPGAACTSHGRGREEIKKSQKQEFGGRKLGKTKSQLENLQRNQRMCWTSHNI